jgi:hypothetical protein
MEIEILSEYSIIKKPGNDGSQAFHTFIINYNSMA